MNEDNIRGGLYLKSKEGWLEVYGAIDSGIFCVYDNEFEFNRSRPRELIDLSAVVFCTVEDSGGENCFKIVHPLTGDFYFSVSSPYELIGWLNHLAYNTVAVVPLYFCDLHFLIV